MEGWMIGVAAGGGLTIFGSIVVGAFRFGGWVGRVDSDRTAFKEFMTEIRKDIAEILLRLSPTPTATAASPVRLTDFGREISRELDVKAWAMIEAEPLLDQARGKQEHEVYDLCIDYVQAQSDKDEALRNTIRASAYRHGIDTAQVQRVYVIELPNCSAGSVGVTRRNELRGIVMTDKRAPGHLVEKLMPAPTPDMPENVAHS